MMKSCNELVKGCLDKEFEIRKERHWIIQLYYRLFGAEIKRTITQMGYY